MTYGLYDGAKDKGMTKGNKHTGPNLKRPPAEFSVPVDVGIIIPLQEEFEELSGAVAGNWLPVKHKPTSSYDYLFECEGRAGSFRCVATFVGGMGETEAGLRTRQLLDSWQPQTVVVLGIAAGISSDVAVGDVVVADLIDSYLQNAKAVRKGRAGFEFELSGESWRPSVDLVNESRNFRYSHENACKAWSANAAERLKDQLSAEEITDLNSKQLVRQQPVMEVGHVASGPVVAASEAFLKFVKGRDRKYLALEMESGGALAAIYKASDPARALVIRGVSDFGDSRKKQFDEVGAGSLRRYAVGNALGYLWQLMECDILSRCVVDSRARENEGDQQDVDDIEEARGTYDFVIRGVSLGEFSQKTDLVKYGIAKFLDIDVDQVSITASPTNSVRVSVTVPNERLPKLIQAIETIDPGFKAEISAALEKDGIEIGLSSQSGDDYNTSHTPSTINREIGPDLAEREESELGMREDGALLDTGRFERDREAPALMANSGRAINRETIAATIAFFHLPRLYEQNATVAFKAIQELHFTLRDAAFPPRVVVMSALTGAIVVVPDGALSDADIDHQNLHAYFGDLAQHLETVGIPIRIGVCHGLVEQFEDVVGDTFIGTAINQAARIGTSLVNQGVLYSESYQRLVAGDMGSPHQPDYQKNLIVAGKDHDQEIRCFEAAKPLRIAAEYDAERLPAHVPPAAREALLIGVDLPRFSAGDDNLLSARFRGYRDAGLKSLNRLGADKLFYSPGGDGGVFAICDVQVKRQMRAKLDEFADELEEETKNNIPEAAILCRIGAHYGRAMMYQNAQGNLVPTGVHVYCADQAGYQIKDGEVAATRELEQLDPQGFAPALSSRRLPDLEIPSLGTVRRHLIIGESEPSGAGGPKEDDEVELIPLEEVYAGVIAGLEKILIEDEKLGGALERLLGDLLPRENGRLSLSKDVRPAEFDVTRLLAPVADELKDGSAFDGLSRKQIRKLDELVAGFSVLGVDPEWIRRNVMKVEKSLVRVPGQDADVFFGYERTADMLPIVTAALVSSRFRLHEVFGETGSDTKRPRFLKYAREVAADTTNEGWLHDIRRDFVVLMQGEGVKKKDQINDPKWVREKFGQILKRMKRAREVDKLPYVVQLDLAKGGAQLAETLKEKLMMTDLFLLCSARDEEEVLPKDVDVMALLDEIHRHLKELERTN